MDATSLASRFGVWVVFFVSAVLVVRVLPLPESPLFLGASIAVVYWLVRERATPDGD
jgi:hypothetical protein